MFWRAVAGCLVSVTSAVAAEDAAGPRSMRMEAPALEATGDAANVAIDLSFGMPVIQVTMNGKGPFKFAVDTGAGGEAHITDALASELALEKIGEVRVADGSKRNAKVVPVFAVATLGFGRITFRNVTAVATNPRSQTIDGVVGMGLLRQFLLTIDYPARSLRLDKSELPAADGSHVFDYRPGPVIVIPVKIGSVEIPTHLDTGNARHPLIVAADIVPTLATRGQPRAIGVAHTVSNTIEMFEIALNAPVQIGALTLPIGEVGYPAVAPGGNLGTRGLLSVVLRLDQKNHRVAFAQH